VYVVSYYSLVPGKTRRRRVWVCYSCILNPRLPYEGTYTVPDEGYYPHTTCFSRKKMHAHLNRHFLAGHKVPERAFHRLETEMGLVVGD
jgi:hypothetical protein